MADDAPPGLPRHAYELGRVLVLSPHLDDAVFGCGALIAACDRPRVATLFAGAPPAGLPLTPWDARCGFASGHEAIRARRLEDAQALARLGAEPLHLDFPDDQYGATVPVEALAQAIVRAAGNADTLLFPLGLFHDDHERTRRAALRARELDTVPRRWLAYEDALYRRKPGLLQAQLAALRLAGLELTPCPLEPTDDGLRKRDAVRCYRSQLAGVGLDADTPGDTALAERYWALAPGRQARP